MTAPRRWNTINCTFQGDVYRTLSVNPLSRREPDEILTVTQVWDWISCGWKEWKRTIKEPLPPAKHARGGRAQGRDESLSSVGPPSPQQIVDYRLIYIYINKHTRVLAVNSCENVCICSKHNIYKGGNVFLSAIMQFTGLLFWSSDTSGLSSALILYQKRKDRFCKNQN